MLIEKVAQTGTTNSNYELGTVLWENPDITQTFVAQDITLNDDISNYDYYRIIYVLIKDSPSLDSVFLPTTDTAYMSYNANYIARRTSNTPSGATIHVNDAYYNQTYGQSGSVDNRYCIPVKVIGYKNTIPTVVQKEWQVYDDQERIIGTWFGKPLYRKVFTFEGPDSSDTNTVLLTNVFTNLDEIISIDGRFIGYNDGVHNNDNVWSINSYYSNDFNNNFYYSKTTNSFLGKVSTRNIDGNFIIIVTYTKTTD